MGLTTLVSISLFFNDTATTEIYTLSLHDALPISRVDEDLERVLDPWVGARGVQGLPDQRPLVVVRSEEHTSELQSRQYLVCRLLLEKKNNSSDLGRLVCSVSFLT